MYKNVSMHNNIRYSHFNRGLQIGSSYKGSHWGPITCNVNIHTRSGSRNQIPTLRSLNWQNVFYVFKRTLSIVYRRNHCSEIPGNYEAIRVIMVIVSSSMNVTWQGKIGIAIMLSVTWLQWRGEGGRKYIQSTAIIIRRSWPCRMMTSLL